MRSVVAVDVGGTTIKGAVISTGGEVLRHQETATPVAAGPDAVVDLVRSVTKELVASAESSQVATVGVVVPGSVDATTGVARFSANIGWRDVPLRDLLARDTSLPTVVDHDVRAAGVAESSIGLTTGLDDSLLVVIGTGIAGVLTVGGHQVTGATGLAGEIGHLPVWPDGVPCPCGQRGCLERYASAAGISRRYLEATGRQASAAEIAQSGSTDQTAALVWGQAVEALAIALAGCTMMFDPAVIVLSGGLSRAGSHLLEPLRTALAQRVRWRQRPPVELSALGARAGVFGAAILAARAAGHDDFSSWTVAATTTGGATGTTGTA
jgi:glucokinase